MSRPVCPTASLARRALLSALSVSFFLLAPGPSVFAQRVMPDAAPMTNFSPLCDGTLVHCLEIDDFAGHIYGHLQVLPKTDRRDTAAVFPFGITLGMFGRFAGGISTSYSFWKEDDALYQQLGPVRLSLVGRLLPIFPLLSSGGGSAQEDDGATHYAPPRGLRLGLAYEHEVRVGPFSGANSLGLLTNLASLAVIGSRMLGPMQLSASVGALYDWSGLFATGQASAQAGLYLPFFKALKLYVEVMGRGFPAYVKKDALLPSVLDPDPIHAQGLVGLGLSFHPHARVDLGVSIQRGFGGLAPWVVSVNFLTLSVGRTYQGRAATPIGQLAGDVTAEAAKSVKEFLENLPIDPKLDENCIIIDDDGRVMGSFGRRTHNGYYCEKDGFRVPIGHELLRDKEKSRLVEAAAGTLGAAAEGSKAGEALTGIVRGGKKAATEPAKVSIHPGQQGKHILGHPNHVPEKNRSILTADPNKLVKHAGTGEQIGDIPLGQAGSKERVDFGMEIGEYINNRSGERTRTTKGIIHYAKDGEVHIVPARP